MNSIYGRMKRRVRILFALAVWLLAVEQCAELPLSQPRDTIYIPTEMKAILHMNGETVCGIFLPHIGKGLFELALERSIKEEPDRNSKTIGILEKGQRLKVIKDTEYMELEKNTVSPWVEIEYEGKRGYLPGGSFKLFYNPTGTISIDNIKQFRFSGKVPEHCEDIQHYAPRNSK